MGHLAATLALGPILLLQGRHVRRVTPVLPEPAGPREGVAGSGPELRLLILGDSAAAGVGAETQDQALSGQLVAALAPHRFVHWKLVARTGAGTAQTLRHMQRRPRERFDVVLTSLGVNDVTGNVRQREWLAAQAELIALLRGEYGAARVLLSALPPMHLFPALPQPLRWYLGAQAKRFNTALAQLAARSEACIHIRPELGQRVELMAADGFHPGPAVYRAWARHVAEVILADRVPRGAKAPSRQG